MKDKATQPREVSQLELVRQSELLKKHLPVSESTLHRMVERGEFPKPVRCSARIKMWRLADIQVWRDQLKP